MYPCSSLQQTGLARKPQNCSNSRLQGCPTPQPRDRSCLRQQTNSHELESSKVQIFHGLILCNVKNEEGRGPTKWMQLCSSGWRDLNTEWAERGYQQSFCGTFLHICMPVGHQLHPTRCSPWHSSGTRCADFANRNRLPSASTERPRRAAWHNLPPKPVAKHCGRGDISKHLRACFCTSPRRSVSMSSV